MKAGFSQQEIKGTLASLNLPEHSYYMRRAARALDIINQDKVYFLGEDVFRVDSQYDDKHYHVEINHGNPGCTCEDFKKNGVACKHMIAATIYKKERQAQPVKVTYDDTENSYHKRGRWWVTDYKDKAVYIIYRDRDGGLHCPCEQGRKRKDCEHKKAVREYLGDNGGGNGGKRIENECGTSRAKALQDKMNGNNGNGQHSDSQRVKSPIRPNNGNGGNQSPSQPMQLDISDPFQEAEFYDIEQIEGRRDGELAWKLSNGEYAISYAGVMKLAEKHDIDFPDRRFVNSDNHTILRDNKAVIAYAQTNGSEDVGLSPTITTRLSGKPVRTVDIGRRRFAPTITTGDKPTCYDTPIETVCELAKRNAARQLLPLPEIKAIEKKVQLEAEFSSVRCVNDAFRWEVAYEKCKKLVGGKAQCDCVITDLVKAGKLRQDNPSHYDRTEWLIIHDACKQDQAVVMVGDKPVEGWTRCVCSTTPSTVTTHRTLSHDDGNNNDGGDNPPSSGKFDTAWLSCAVRARCSPSLGTNLPVPPADNNREVRLCQVVWRGKTKSSVASCTSAREHRQEFGCVENAIEFQNSLDPKFRKGSCIIDSKTGEAIKVDPDDDNPPGGRHGGNDDDGNNDGNPSLRSRTGFGDNGSNQRFDTPSPREVRYRYTGRDDDWKAKLKECKETALNAQRFDWLKSDLQHEGVISDNPALDWQDSDFETLKQACALDTSLFNRSLGDDFHIQKERNWGGYESSRRYRFWMVTKDTNELREKCFVCRQRAMRSHDAFHWFITNHNHGKTKSQAQMTDDLIHWERYYIKTVVCADCLKATTKADLTRRFDELYKAGPGAVNTDGLPKPSEDFINQIDSARALARLDKRGGNATPSERAPELPQTADDFVNECKEVTDSVNDDNSVEANEQPLEGLRLAVDSESDNGKRKLQMDKKLRTWLVETDGTKKEISCREICEQFESEKNPNIVTRLRAGIDSGADISTVELDN